MRKANVSLCAAAITLVVLVGARAPGGDAVIGLLEMSMGQSAQRTAENSNSPSQGLDAGTAQSGYDGAESAVPYAEIIDRMATAHGVDPRLIRAMIEVESGYRPRARSPRGAMGLMQLSPVIARHYEVADPYEPAANIEAGVRHFKGLLAQYGVPLALAAYNAGETAVERHGGIPPYRETQDYVRRVLAAARRPPSPR